MDSIINILPEFLSNQIAAGEVVNRPSAVVKELLENSVDAGATEMELHVQNAGKTLIMVIDNGKGMSEKDVPLAFTRHATSKLSKVEDLNNIRTMGFRGEALPSIASISQLEMKTRREEDELGVRFRIEGEDIKQIEACVCPKGTQISVRNIYYNTPARRQFLKRDELEFEYIEQEFIKIALAHPHIKFLFEKDGKTLYQLAPGTLYQRVIQIFGKSYESRIVSVDETLADIKVYGYLCKPEFAIKRRNKQYLFVNNRYFKHLNIGYAIERAYENLVLDKNYPIYFLFIEIDPSKIDVNIHPTKMEVRFQDDKLVSGVLTSICKRAMGICQITPELNFDQPEYLKDFTLDALMRPDSFQSRNFSPEFPANYSFSSGDDKFVSREYQEDYRKSFEEFYKSATIIPSPTKEGNQPGLNFEEENVVVENNYIQIDATYIVSKVAEGLLVVDQSLASETILFDKFKNDGQETFAAQRCLFPETIDLSVSQAELAKSIQTELKNFGWDLEWLGGQSFMVNALPCGMEDENPQLVIEELLDCYNQNRMQYKETNEENMRRATAKKMAVRKGKILTKYEMESLVTRLFLCENPRFSPDGRKVYCTIGVDEIKKIFI